MFGFAKKRPVVTPEQLVRIYIVHCMNRTRENFGSFNESMLFHLKRLNPGMSQTRATDLIDEIYSEFLYTAAICALGALAISNIYPEKTADRLLAELRRALVSEYGGKDTFLIKFNEFTNEMRDSLKSGESLPHDSAALLLACYLGFTHQDETINFLNDVLTMAGMGTHLLQSTAKFWKQAKDEVDLSI